jgi:ABC-type multidrug transport system fused ATPase/permease subunit
MRILLRLMTFARKYWWLLVLAFVCMMASTAFALIIPQLISRVVDTVLGEGRHGDLIWLGIAVVAAGALRGLSAFGNSYLSEVLYQKCSLRQAPAAQLFLSRPGSHGRAYVTGHR